MAGRLVGLIPAAGLGTRVRPYSANLPKSMLPINGIPNLQRIVELMRDQLDIREIVIVTGYRAVKKFHNEPEPYSARDHRPAFRCFRGFPDDVCRNKRTAEAI